MERDPTDPTASYRSSSPEADAGSTESGRRVRANQLVGAVLIDRFELLQLLGVGAFGEVYRARDRQNPSTPSALKILRRPSAQALYRFKREFRALGEWSHPNLVSLHELFLDEEKAFFSMELVAGGDFLSYVRPGGVLSRERLFGAMQGLCEGVSALHQRGRLHRDLKPANVLVEPSGRVVIVDLGLATLFGRGAAHGSELGFIGTVQYAAPEQLSLGTVGPETDWYAVGAMLYEALTGVVPYDAPFVEQLQEKSRPPAPLPLANDEIDPLRGACVALLQPDKRLRAGACELRAALGRNAAAIVASEPPFVGRNAELELLSQLFQEVEAGAARVAVVSAPSGLGKTALIERFLRNLAGEHRATVLSGRCYVNEEVTYQAIDGVIDALSHHLSNLPRVQVAALLPRDVRSLSRLFPVLNRVDGIATAPPVRSLDDATRSPDDRVSLRERAGAALRELVGRLSDRLPLVLFIDDIQWDDEDSAWLLARLLAPPDPPAVMLVLTCRKEGRAESDLLRVLESEPTTARQIHEIALPTLSSGETALLAEHASAVVSAERALAERIALESGGHPLFALELARFAQGGALDAAGTAQLSLDAALLSRSEKLSAPARRLLEIVCVAGHPLKYTVAVSAAGCEVDAVRELVTNRLVAISGTANDDTLSVYHDRIRDSELSALPAERVRALHGVLADAMAGNEKRADRIVEHYLAAGRRAAAASFALRAADHAAAVLAFHRLPALLLLALEDPAQTALGPLHLRLAESYALLGQRGAAADAYQKAAALEADPERSWELSSLGMWQAFHAQDLEQGFRLLHQLDRALGRERLRATLPRIVESLLRGLSWQLLGPPPLRPKPATPGDGSDEKRLRLAFRAYISLVPTRGVDAMFYAVEAFRLAAKLGDAAVYAASLAGFATALSLRSGFPSARCEAQLAQARALAEASGDEGVRLLVESALTGYAYTIGRPEEQKLLPLLDAAFPATPFGTFVRSLAHYAMGAPMLFWSGHVSGVRRHAARAIALAREFDDPQVEAGLRAMSAYRLLSDDDAETAWREWVSSAERYPRHPVLRAPTFGVVIALYQGRLERAELVMRKAWQLFWDWEVFFGPNRAVFAWWWGGVAAARLRRGEKGLGLRLRLWFCCAFLAGKQPPMVGPLADALRAARALLRGKSARALRTLERARAGFEAGGLSLFSACASHLLARLHPDRGQAAAHAARARALFEQEQIRCPEKWVQALLPGLADLPPPRASAPARDAERGHHGAATPRSP